MFKFCINDVEYSCPDTWQELTIKDAAKLQQMIRELPEGVQSHYRSIIEADDKVTALSDEVELFAFQRKAISILGNVPDEVAAYVPDSDITEVFSRTLLLFTVSLISSPLYELQGLDSFEYMGETFCVARPGVDVAGEAMPMETLTARELCEASDIVSADSLALAPILLAVLCRPEGEEYDEVKIKERAKLFEALPMHLYFEIIALLNSTHAYLAEEYPICYGKGKGTGAGEVSTWSDRLLFVGNDLPSELPTVENMPAYEFVKVLAAKIKREIKQWTMRSMLN